MWPDSARRVFSANDLARLGPVAPASPAPDPAALATAEVVFTGWGAPRLDADFLAAAPRLRAVFHAAGGVRDLVSPALWERGITLCSAVEANAVPVAEYVFACLILGLKGLLFRAAGQRAPSATWWSQPEAAGTYGSTVGLVGLGTIGRRVLARLRTLEVNVLVHDPQLAAAEAESLGVERVSLVELFACADAVSLHAALLPATRRLIRARHLAALRPGATFINTARGGLLHEPELAAFLCSRPDVQAFLDVTDPEPPAPDSPLRSLPNVFLTPHLAGSHGRECQRLGRAMVEDYERWLVGEPLRHKITAAQATRMG
jgi:phosphoglycerate dehydrogenase-like enzyme